MQQGGLASPLKEAAEELCVFCQPEQLARFTLKETPSFRIVTDHAPLLEGHLLIMPRQHYACYGTTPAELDEELRVLKQEVARFFAQHYAPIIFWEHGVFRQTVYHAHLHCFPFGEVEVELSSTQHAAVIQSQDELRAWYRAHGHYFYLENTQHGLVFSPEMDQYMRVVKEVLYPYAVTRSGFAGWRTSTQRMEAGGPLIKALTHKWQQFQQQEHPNAY